MRGLRCSLLPGGFLPESRESSFLSAVLRRMPPAAAWNDEKGWLTPGGCSLSVGRPPVCYAFYCKPIADARPTPEAAYALAVLSALMGYAGRNAYGRRHLVELFDLTHLNLNRLEKQCGTAGKVLAHLAAFWDHPGRRSLDRELCAGICRPPRQ